jgi:hypothetical protein
MESYLKIMLNRSGNSHFVGCAVRTLRSRKKSQFLAFKMYNRMGQCSLVVKQALY